MAGHPQVAGYSLFHGPKHAVDGVLNKITPIESELRQKVEDYVNEVMHLDHIYTQQLYGRVNPSLNKDYEYFWESPWVEEHIIDSNKRRRINEQEKSLAVRSFIKYKATQETNDVDDLLLNIKKLQKWEESDAKNSVKTVSRVVHSFEQMAIRRLFTTLQGLKRPAALANLTRLCSSPANPTDLSNGMSPAAHALRRSALTRDMLVSLVTVEILIANGIGQNGSINQRKALNSQRDVATFQLINALEECPPYRLPRDTIGLPLMYVNCNLCVQKGILVVTNGNTATYILDIDNEGEEVSENFESITTINITHVFKEAEGDDVLLPTTVRTSKPTALAPYAVGLLG